MASLRLPAGLTAATAIGTAILVGLGYWQWERRLEKRAFLDRLEQQLDAVPAPLPADPAPLTRVTLSGHFLAGKSAAVQATLPAAKPGKSLGGLGYWWLTAFETQGGRIVLVNRGFVPTGPDGKAMQVATPTGEQTIVGIVRAPDAGNYFVPTDVPAKREFFRRDPALLAAPLGLTPEPAGKLAPFTVDVERSGDAITPPVGLDVRELIAQVPNNHLQYALTWWGLACTLLGVYLAKLISDRRKPAAPADSGASRV